MPLAIGSIISLWFLWFHDGAHSGFCCGPVAFYWSILCEQSTLCSQSSLINGTENDLTNHTWVLSFPFPLPASPSFLFLSSLLWEHEINLRMRGWLTCCTAALGQTTLQSSVRFSSVLFCQQPFILPLLMGLNPDALVGFYHFKGKNQEVQMLSVVSSAAGGKRGLR